MPNLFPTLTQSFKHRFPFRLSAPSFVYPADYVTNVRHLGAHVDEIELLLFESQSEALPSKAEVVELAALARHLDLSYNVHLPLDLDLGVDAPDERRDCIGRLVSVIDLVRPLSPTTHTLHLNFREKKRSDAAVQAWQARTMDTLSRFLPLAAAAPQAISIETLDYPPHWLAPMIERFDLAVCVDVGHVLRYGFDLRWVLTRFAHRIAILHLHGVLEGRDHLALDALPAHARQIMQQYLKKFRGTVSLEVFSLGRLQASLACLADMMGAAQ
jgi:sugar phosphate isomerase/epimerase